jgi:hypothetical protein
MRAALQPFLAATLAASARPAVPSAERAFG